MSDIATRYLLAATAGAIVGHLARLAGLGLLGTIAAALGVVACAYCAFRPDPDFENADLDDTTLIEKDKVTG